MTRQNLRIGLKREVSARLRPVFFGNRGFTWNRRVAEFVDVVEVEWGKADTQSDYSFTISAGVCWPNAYRAAWQRPVPTWVTIVDCTVRQRVGVLATGFDTWWQSKDRTDDEMTEDAADKLTRNVLPFLDGMHSLPDMERFLVEHSRGFSYPPELIYYVTLLRERGEIDEARRVLEERLRRSAGAWTKDLQKLLDLSKAST